MHLNKNILGAATVAALSLSGLLPASTTASADVACNREGDCWHTEERRFDRGLGIVIHPDDWYFNRHWDGDLTIIGANIMKAADIGAAEFGSSFSRSG